jgi:hypothetical protein
MLSLTLSHCQPHQEIKMTKRSNACSLQAKASCLSSNKPCYGHFSILTLCTSKKCFDQPLTTVATTMKLADSRTSSLFQWLPPPCQNSCFFTVDCGPYTYVLPGFFTVFPATLLAKQLPYIYKCSCSNVSNNTMFPTMSRPTFQLCPL